jgi:hypothetical protein
MTPYFYSLYYEGKYGMDSAVLEELTINSLGSSQTVTVCVPYLFVFTRAHSAASLTRSDCTSLTKAYTEHSPVR